MSHEQPYQHLSANPRAENLAAAGKNVLVAGRRGNRAAFIQAGALYERGEEEAARELLGSINPSDLSEGEAQEYQVLREVLEPGQT